MTINLFLNLITYPDNNICRPTYFFDVESVSSSYILSTEDTEDIASSTPSTSMASNSEPSTSTACTAKPDDLLCCICQEKKSNVAVFPCNNFKTCLACWLRWKQMKKNLRSEETDDEDERNGDQDNGDHNAIGFIPNGDLDINDENVQKHLKDEGEKLTFTLKCPYCYTNKYNQTH